MRLADFIFQETLSEEELTSRRRPKILNAMKSDPLAVALHHVAETRLLLESLIVSSESFDYQQAKAALNKLQRKARDLGKLQQQMEKVEKAKRHLPKEVSVLAPASAKGKICVVNFKAGNRVASSSL